MAEMQSSSDFFSPHDALRPRALPPGESAAVLAFWGRLVLKSAVLVALGAAPWLGIFWLIGVL
jgi:hypothetical protein